MPIYEYRCESCGGVFEEHQSFRDKPLTECKSCGGALKKIFSPAGIIFKGSGFHVTDYGKKGSPSKSDDVGKTKNETSKQPSK